MANIQRGGQLIAGIVVAGLGVLLVIERIAGFDIYGIWQLWPLILIGIGISRLAGGDGAKRQSSGLFLVVLGLWFLVNTLHLFGLYWGTSWPLFLVGLGVSNLIVPDSGGRSGGFLLILIGLWALANVLELWGLDWRSSWPFAIIIVGLVIVWKALFEHPKAGCTTACCTEEKAHDNS